MYATNYCGNLLHLNHLQIKMQSLQAHTQKHKCDWIYENRP